MQLLKHKRRKKMQNLISKDKFTYAEILRAYLQCRKHKRNTSAAVNFENNFTSKLELLLEQVNSGTYQIGKHDCFAVLNPKPREVWAAPFKDRIIHHLIYNEIQYPFEKNFIDQTYSCIRNRGTLKCIKDAFKGIRKITKNYQEEAFYIKLDIQNFFVSINKEILWNVVKEKVNENCLLGKLIKQNIFQDVTKNARLHNLKSMKKVPAYKSLFNVNNMEQGLPIGNLTSQFFSNVYLNALDQFCKHKLKLKYYYRYADDILILISNTSNARIIINSINNWLIENRKLQLNLKKTVINRLKLGVKFLGTRLFFHYIIPSENTFQKLNQAKDYFQRNIFNKKAFFKLNSYLGLSSQFNIYNYYQKLLDNCHFPFIYDRESKKIYYL